MEGRELQIKGDNFRYKSHRYEHFKHDFFLLKLKIQYSMKYVFLFTFYSHKNILTRKNMISKKTSNMIIPLCNSLQNRFFKVYSENNTLLSLLIPR